MVTSQSWGESQCTQSPSKYTPHRLFRGHSSYSVSAPKEPWPERPLWNAHFLGTILFSLNPNEQWVANSVHYGSLSGQICIECANWEPTTLDSSWTQQATFCYGFTLVKRKPEKQWTHVLAIILLSPLSSSSPPGSVTLRWLDGIPFPCFGIQGMVYTKSENPHGHSTQANWIMYALQK